MNEVRKLISRYLNDDASDDQIQTLFAWVREKPENAAEFARACALHAGLRRRLHGQQQLSEEHSQFVRRRAGVQPTGKSWERRISAVNRFLVAAVLLMTLQMSWGALTLLELCRTSAVSVAQETDSVKAE